MLKEQFVIGAFLRLAFAANYHFAGLEAILKVEQRFYYLYKFFFDVLERR
jgi:hypothetical protein